MVKNRENCSELQAAIFLIFEKQSLKITPDLRATNAGYWEEISQ